MKQEGAPKADLDVNFAGSPPVSDCVSSLPVQEAKGDEPINIMNSVKCLRLTGTKAGQKIPAFGWLSVTHKSASPKCTPNENNSIRTKGRLIKDKRIN